MVDGILGNPINRQLPHASNFSERKVDFGRAVYVGIYALAGRAYQSGVLERDLNGQRLIKVLIIKRDVMLIKSSLILKGCYRLTHRTTLNGS
jgi:hypothetical protein